MHRGRMHDRWMYLKPRKYAQVYPHYTVANVVIKVHGMYAKYSFVIVTGRLNNK